MAANDEVKQTFPLETLVGLVMPNKYIWRHVLLTVLLWRFYERCSYLLFGLCLLSAAFRIFSCHAFGHRYFCHRSFEVGKTLEFIMAMTICTTELCNFHYWSLMHDHHHRHCDHVEDIHSPAFLGWWPVQSNYQSNAKDLFLKYAGNGKLEKKFSSYVNDFTWMVPIKNLVWMVAENVFWMFVGYMLGFYPLELWLWVNFLPRMYTLNALTLTNSAAHMFGTKPYVGNGRPPFGDCNATNCWWAALLNGGEGWHNNHHAFSKSAKHGLMWWEVDCVWYGIYLLGCVGLVWNVNIVSDEAIQSCRYKVATGPVAVKYVVLFAKESAKNH